MQDVPEKSDAPRRFLSNLAAECETPIFFGPFGARRIIYADFTASGRSLRRIEHSIQRFVLPFYGNTHTEASHTGSWTTRIREAARLAIRRSVNAAERHAVIFCGSGSTAAVHKLVTMLGMTLPAGSREREILRSATPESERPVVIVGPFEHHSNELPWRESLATVIRLPLDALGQPCVATLEERLLQYADRPQRIVALSAASNVTGVVTDLCAVARLVHRHRGRLFVDYAAGAPYLPINMAGTGDGDHIDAAFISPHKFVGGPGASGILVADRALHLGEMPTAAGGGTVRFVSPSRHSYVSDIEQLEEAGTPGILGDIRAGLVMQLKSDIGTDTIHEAERRATARAQRRWGSYPAIKLLGPPSTQDRLPIFSFNIRSGNRWLHYGFVVQLLNDLFGIQGRGGCSCAGPYGHDLLDIDETLSLRYQALVDAKLELFRPGWVRVGLHYTFSDETIDAIVEAVAFVARRGKSLLPLYAVDMASGRWIARGHVKESDGGWEGLCGSLRGEEPASRPCEDAPDFAACLQRAHELADEAGRIDVEPPAVPPEAEEVRSFWLPGER